MTKKNNTPISQMPHDRINRTFMGYHVGLDGELYCCKTGRKKYKWVNYGKESKYYRTQFWYEGKRVNIYLHRICALINLPDFDDQLEVNHINGDGLDNAYGNHVMSERTENAEDAITRRVSKRLRGTGCEFKYGYVREYRPKQAGVA